MSEKILTKEQWMEWKEQQDKKTQKLAEEFAMIIKKASPTEREIPENKHLHTLNEQIDCPDCYPEIRKKVYDKEFKNADAQCVGCGLLAKKQEAEKDEWECPNCGSKTAKSRD